MGNFILMPKLGMTMTTGKIIKWLKNNGEKIEKGDFIFEVETDKTSLEVESLYGGVLLAKYYDEGCDVPCNSEIGYVGAAGEEIPALPVKTAVEQEPEEAPANMTEEKQLPASGFQYEYDLAVVGAGPGGYVAALRAAQLGARVCLIERDELGGACLNRGCIPTKALYASAKRWKTICRADEFGFKVKGAAFDFAAIMENKNQIVRKLTGGVASLMKKNKIEVVRGIAKIEKEHEVIVADRKIRSRFILLATGGHPASVLKNAGDGVVIQNTDTLMELKSLPASAVIVGGGIIGCEIGCILNSFGVKITIVELLSTILPMVDRELSACLAENMAKNGIGILNGLTADGIEKKGGINSVQLSNGTILDCEMIIEAVGRKINKDAFESLGVQLTAKGFVETDDFMCTNLESIYAIGDITGKCQLAHAASEQGIAAAERMFGGRTEAEEQTIPSCIFTDIEIATVGLTEEQAKEKGYDIRTFKFPFAANGKALTLGENEGFVKVVCDSRFGEILGVHIIGPEASSLIHEAVMAVRLEATAEYAGTTVHAHPTLSEALMEAFLGCSRGALHM